MASKVTPWYKKKRVSQVKTDYAYDHTKCVSAKQHTAVRTSSSKSVSQVQAQATAAMAEPTYTVPAFRQRTAEEGTEEYQRVSTKVEKGLTVIQEELHRMRMATKTQVDNIAIQREVRDMMYKKTNVLEDIPKSPDFLVALRPHTVWEKTPVKLFCTVQGNPRPIVKWYKGGVPVDPLTAPGKYKIENKYGVHSLIISRCAVSDTAEYSAVATNVHGTATSKATVTVKRASGSGESCLLGLVPHLTEIHPSKLEVSMLDRFSVSFGVEGGSISLVCTLVVVPDLPNLPPLAQWYRDDKLLKPSKLAEMSVGGGAARLTLPHLAKDDEGLYTLRIFTKDGTTEHSAYLFVSDAAPSKPGAPGAPLSVKAYDINADYVLVAWKPPNTVNEAVITGYFVDRCDSGSDTWVQCNDAPVKVCKYPVHGLKVGHSYHFRVRAVNSAGVSRPSRKSDKVTALDAAESERLQGTDEGVPSAPGQVVATRNTKSSVFVQWDAPKHLKNLMGYYIDGRIAGSKEWFPCNHKPYKHNRFVVHGLIPGESYTFRVQAVNVYGLSEESQESSSITVEPALGKGVEYATPSAPFGITLLSCDGSSMTLAWKSPKHSGGSKVNAYYIDKRNADSLVWKEVNLAAITERVCTVDSLTEGTFYEFKVQAANMAGVGVPSAPSTPMKCEAWTMEEPGPAYDLSFSEVRSQSLVLLWKAPVYTGASAVTGYLVDMAKKGSSEFVTLTQEAVNHRYLQVTGLTEGETYVFRVRSVNAAGVGKPSQLSEPICAKALPGTKEIVAGVDEETGDVFLSFEACEICETSKFVWSKNYKAIGECPRVAVTNKGRTSRLTFSNPDKDDLGTYSVVVTDTDGVSSRHTLIEDALNTMLELSYAIRHPVVPLKHGLNYEVLEKGHVRFWVQAVKLSPSVSYRFIVNDKEVKSGEGIKISHDVATGVIQMTLDQFTRANEGTYTVQITDGKAKVQSSLVLVGDVFKVALKEAEFQRKEHIRKQGPHFSEYLYFTVTEDCTVMLACKVANVKKETSFHWYKEDEEIVPETPPNVMSGACALPIPLFSRKDHGIYKAVLSDDRGKDTSLFDISGKVFDDIINALAKNAGASASELVLQCTPEGIRLQCYMNYYTEEMKTVWKHKESKIASSEKMRIGGTAEMAWMQICDPSDKEKGNYSIEISDGVQTHTRSFDLSGQASTDAYEEFLRAEQINHFLSEKEILFILENAELPVVEEEDPSEGKRAADEDRPSTYFPTESDEEVPDLDLGWPEVSLEDVETNISLLFQPPRQNTPTIKEVVRKQIQKARKVIAIAMDVFTDVDIFKEIITATLRGVVVYILLDEAQFKSFLTMSHRVGVNIQDLKTLRVRTVQGQQYQCQSGVKFHGDLEQRFLMVDCKTVVYGTYSYTWAFEKINLSMVLVITGQLVGSYDEEFRRLYARSSFPVVLSREKPSVLYLRDTVGLQSPNSSQVFLHQIQKTPKVMPDMRITQDDRINNAAIMTRGLSVQDRLHQSHCLDMGNLVRGHSYGGELQNLNSISRLRMGTKNVGVPFAPENTGSKVRGGGDSLLTNRMSHQHIRHQTRYGADQNMIPFNSETSLNRWKIDTYFNDSNMPLDASCDALSPMASPYSSHTGLNEHQSQLIHNRSRDIKSRMEELRQKRLSLQEYSNLKQSQESLRSLYMTVERPKFVSLLRGMDKRHSAAELEPKTVKGCSLEAANPRDGESNKGGNKREQPFTDGHRSASHFNVTMAQDRKTTQTYDWHEPLSRTTSAAELEMKLKDPLLKLSHLQPSGLQHPRAMESLIEIPEEKEGSRVNSSDSAAFKDENEEIRKDKKAVPKESTVQSSVSAESQRQDQARGRRGSVGKAANSSGSPAPREGIKSTPNETQPVPKIVSTSTGPQHAANAKSSHIEKEPTQREEPPLQRKNSLRKKVYLMLSPDEKKASKKHEKSLQRKASLRSSLNPSGSNQPLRSAHSQAPVPEQTTEKGQLPSITRSQSSLGSQPETEKHKSPFQRLSPQRSSKKKPNPAGEPDRGSKNTLDAEGATAHHTKREKVYSRFEYYLSSDSIPQDKSMTGASMLPSEKDRGSSPNNHDSGYPTYETQSGTDNKLGRFMQRVGNLIGKNK
ncbi:myomesin-2-like isoform X6 [Etheostoma cragini]|uniref:myomesin-2-like isoform X6 n=1 Tax=Etheostoma cragini TaxID=417921 RepID=UPI00155EFC30|nr:myomesin-2-like isoform X6 [Etheostoma cragini]